MTSSHRPFTGDEVERLTVDAEPWLSCDDCFHLVDQDVDALLGDGSVDMPAMHAHLRGCGACRDEAESLVELAAADRGIDVERALARLRVDHPH